MAYCKSCGAYIPDGQSVCLACGYDDTADRNQAASSSSAGAAQAAGKETGQPKYKQFDSDFLRRQLDEQRKRQQENNRKWAESEYAQRQKVKEEQQKNFTSTSGRSDGEYARAFRSAYDDKKTGKIFAALSYFSFLFVLPYFFRKDDKFAAFHAKQGMTLFIAGIVARAIGSLFHVGWVIDLIRYYMIYRGVNNVVKEKEEPLPYIGDLIK